jgi:hypothetical protein
MQALREKVAAGRKLAEAISSALPTSAREPLAAPVGQRARRARSEYGSHRTSGSTAKPAGALSKSFVDVQTHALLHMVVTKACMCACGGFMLAVALPSACLLSSEQRLYDNFTCKALLGHKIGKNAPGQFCRRCRMVTEVCGFTQAMSL